MTTTTHCNPINALSLLEEMDMTNRAYLGRTLVSSINAMLIGQLVLHVKNTTPDENSGIDGANDMLAAALEREIDKVLSDDAGQESSDPEENACILMNLATEICETLNLSANITAAINTPLETLQYIAQRNGEVKIDNAAAEQLAKALEIDIDTAKQAMLNNARRRAEDFTKIAPMIPEALSTLQPSGTFDDLPNRLKMRIAQKFEQHLARKLANEIGRVVGGSVNNMGDITYLKEAIKPIKAWIAAHSDTDELARALRAAA